ncbi:MAG: PD-(D/E)XK nuclease family protein [Bacilli bacterium]|nr:PD-(D/E)XK nuclease family protein [Bacilli bacterium]
MEIKERILYAPGANETELLRSLAKRGIKTLGLRIMGSKDLAVLALERNGIALDRNLVNDTLCGLMAYNLLKEEKYFETVQLKDSLNFISSLNELRLTIPDWNSFEILKNGVFAEKNEAFLKVFSKYNQKLIDSKNYDVCSLVKSVIDKKIRLDIDVFTTKEFPLKPLEKLLLKSLKGYENNQIDFNISSSYKIEEYNSFFSEKAEAEFVLNFIYKNHLKLDECIVAVTNPKYRRIFEDVAIANCIPVNFGIPKCVNETNAGKVLSLIIKWERSFNHVDKFKEIFDPKFMNLEKVAHALDIEIDKLEKVLEKCGNLRLSLDVNKNNSILDNFAASIEHHLLDAKKEQINLYYMQRMADILKRGISGLLDFVIIKDPIEDPLAIEKINGFYNQAIDNGLEGEQVLDAIANIEIGSSVSSEGSLFVTTIKKAKSVHRKYLFVVGMSSELYPGKPSEDYIILDSDYELLGFNGRKSHQSIEEKKNDLKTLLSLNSDNKIFISYPYYSTEDLKHKNASSLIFEVFNDVNGGNQSVDDMLKNVRKHSYFENNLSPSREVGLAYAKGTIFKHDELEENKDFDVSINNRKKEYFSASEIDSYFLCPYKFYLERIIGLEDDFQNDVTEVISSSDLGNLVHNALTDLDIKETSKEEFVDHILANFSSDYLTTHTVISEEMVKSAIDDLKDIGGNAYDLASDHEPFMVETDLYAIHEPSGLGIHGFPDRAEIVLDEKIKIIDYKVKNSVTHDANNLSTCGQILTYAYLIKRKNKDILSCEYRYLKQGLNVTIPSEQMNEAIDYFDKTMINLKNSLRTGRFEPLKEEDEDGVCKYCKFRDLCPTCKSEKGEDE